MWKKHQNQNDAQLEERSNLRSFSLIVFLVVSCFTAFAQGPHYTYTHQLLKLQQLNFNLELLPARDSLTRIGRMDVQNKAVSSVLHFNYWLEAFVSERDDVYDRYSAVRDSVIVELELLHDSVEYKALGLADVYFYSGVLQAKLNNLYSAVRSMNKAFELAQHNIEVHPQAMGNNKIPGLVRVYMSTVPENYQWVTKMLGMEGDLKQGLRDLHQLAHYPAQHPVEHAITKETGYLYAFSLYHIAKKQKLAWAETLRVTRDYPTSLLSVYFRSNIALRLGMNESAIKVLEMRPQGEQYYNFPFLEYQMGLAKLRRLDSTSIHHFTRFEHHFRGKNYVKSNLEKMSWHQLLFEGEDEYLLVSERIRYEGRAYNEEDKQALQSSKKPIPHTQLLKARLLYDGGYIDSALVEINKVNSKALTTDQLAEYCYRKGRIFEQLGKKDVALKFYLACSLVGRKSPEYYASYACLYLADAYTEEGEVKKAREYYSKAMENEFNKEYRSSIEQRAKLGLKQLEKNK